MPFSSSVDIAQQRHCEPLKSTPAIRSSSITMTTSVELLPANRHPLNSLGQILKGFCDPGGGDDEDEDEHQEESVENVPSPIVVPREIVPDPVSPSNKSRGMVIATNSSPAEKRTLQNFLDRMDGIQEEEPVNDDTREEVLLGSASTGPRTRWILETALLSLIAVALTLSALNHLGFPIKLPVHYAATNGNVVEEHEPDPVMVELAEDYFLREGEL